MATPTSVLSLCAGGGGLDFGLRLAVPGTRTVCYVENEVTASGVLVKSMASGRMDDAPLWTDLRTFDGAAWRGVVDCVIGGYPCQPFSNAGKQLGDKDPRHLWPAVADIVRAVEPRWCFFENVGAHLRLGGREVIRDLQGMGYRTAAVLLTAEEVGAPHGRERLFILADSGSISREVPQASFPDGTDGTTTSSTSRNPSQEIVGNANIQRWPGRGRPYSSKPNGLPAWPPGPEDYEGWAEVVASGGLDYLPAVPQPTIRGVAHGVERGIGRSDQLHVLGNGVVPQQAAYAFHMLSEALVI